MIKPLTHWVVFISTPIVPFLSPYILPYILPYRGMAHGSDTQKVIYMVFIKCKECKKSLNII